MICIFEDFRRPYREESNPSDFSRRTYANTVEAGRVCLRLNERESREDFKKTYLKVRK